MQVGDSGKAAAQDWEGAERGIVIEDVGQPAQSLGDKWRDLRSRKRGSGKQERRVLIQDQHTLGAKALGTRQRIHVRYTKVKLRREREWEWE